VSWVRFLNYDRFGFSFYVYYTTVQSCSELSFCKYWLRLGFVLNSDDDPDFELERFKPGYSGGFPNLADVKGYEGAAC
jgi:hypothetical protein